MNAFHVLGAILAVWAVIVAFLGISRHDFPRSQSIERAVIGISGLLVAAAIGSAIVTAISEEDEHSEGGGAEAVEPQP